MNEGVASGFSRKKAAQPFRLKAEATMKFFTRPTALLACIPGEVG
jgi:hypothetical protein